MSRSRVGTVCSAVVTIVVVAVAWDAAGESETSWASPCVLLCFTLRVALTLPPLSSNHWFVDMWVCELIQRWYCILSNSCSHGTC